ncbi:MAG: hypothetical protein U9N09_04095, partial [Euryarchaeota archaeon]|nr:hypothetical protein [Euryarchaeota archaeon]
TTAVISSEPAIPSIVSQASANSLNEVMIPDVSPSWLIRVSDGGRHKRRWQAHIGRRAHAIAGGCRKDRLVIGIGTLAVL